LLTAVWKLRKRKRSIAEGFGVSESTLRKRLKLGTVPTSVGPLKAAFSNEEEKKMADYCRNLVARFCSLKELGRRAGMTLIADLTKKRRIPKITRRSAFAKDRMVASKYSLGRNVGFSEVQVTRFFDKVSAAFEKHNFLQKEFQTRMKVFQVSCTRGFARKRKTPGQHCMHKSRVTDHCCVLP
jgi:hypothetical protein